LHYIKYKPAADRDLKIEIQIAGNPIRSGLEEDIFDGIKLFVISVLSGRGRCLLQFYPVGEAGPQRSMWP